ncbi:MAG: HRDC domain-containing protein [Planctomycetaceae bacterium]|nr:HRDC domain-containing protein [Planctomycetaceae bacterium]
MSYITVSRSSELTTFLRHLGGSPWVAFDTEFIAERKYQSQLCLIQVAGEGLLGIIDPLSLDDLTPFWEFLCDAGREVFAHACRSEIEFCFRAIRRVPERLFDVQLAAGFVVGDYPCSFGNLLENHLQMTIPKEETRTDWARRPLSSRQIGYALNDVRYLQPLAKKLKKKLSSLERSNWYQEEMSAMLERLAQDFLAPHWRVLSGTNGLTRRELAIARELWLWRDETARRYNISANLLLRDDLLIELARRKSPDPKRISAIRGLQRKDMERNMAGISEAIQRGLDCPEQELPDVPERCKTPQYTQMVQLLYSGLAMLCRRNHIATGIVGTQADVRDLIAFRFGTLNGDTPKNHPPKLKTGWRATIVGDFLDQLLDGEIAIRIDKTDPNSPMQFVHFDVKELMHNPEHEA